MRIKNWKKFQHFKDRRPPWIKLHREILDQRDINLISDKSFRVLIGLWLLAAEDEQKEGNLPDIEEIAFRLREKKSVITSCLGELKSFVLQGDITMISERYQVGPPEAEERRGEESIYTLTSGPPKKNISSPTSHNVAFDKFWEVYPNKKGKGAARKAWNKAKINGKLDMILKAVEEQKSLDQWVKDKGQFIPYPATWLNQERWEDEVQAKPKKGPLIG